MSLKDLRERLQLKHHLRQVGKHLDQDTRAALLNLAWDFIQSAKDRKISTVEWAELESDLNALRKSWPLE